MSQKPISLNADLRRLRDEGYNIEIHAGYLIARDIPYLNSVGKVCRGILATALDLNGDLTNRPSDHTVKFAGDYPCTAAGMPIEGIRNTSAEVRLSEQLTMQHTFSSKPSRGYYIDYYEKIKTYTAILGGHASQVDPSTTARTFMVVVPTELDSPFCYIDTASARAEINETSRKLAADTIAIVGLGGTGSYVLDLVAKTPVKAIHLFDGDKFSSHNAFRAPGAAAKSELQSQQLKVDYFAQIYSRMHKGIVVHGSFIGEANIDELKSMTCVFLCIDSGSVKKAIVSKLEEFGVTFIDVGMGLYAKGTTLGGIVRVTTSEPGDRERSRSRIPFSEAVVPNEYDRNIQIADLNALNAVMAVIRWKKLRSFYFDLKRERFSAYTIGTNRIVNEDVAKAD